MRPLAHTLKQYIQRRDKQDANHRRHQHPLNTVVPMIRRLCAPAPVASIIGMMPIINDTAVIITARKRRVAPLAQRRLSTALLAPAAGELNVRIAFFAAGAISSTSPI